MLFPEYLLKIHLSKPEFRAAQICSVTTQVSSTGRGIKKTKLKVWGYSLSDSERKFLAHPGQCTGYYGDCKKHESEETITQESCPIS